MLQAGAIADPIFIYNRFQLQLSILLIQFLLVFSGVELMIPVVGFYCPVCKVVCYDYEDAKTHLLSDEHNEKYIVSVLS